MPHAVIVARVCLEPRECGEEGVGGGAGHEKQCRAYGSPAGLSFESQRMRKHRESWTVGVIDGRREVFRIAEEQQ